MLPIQVCGHGPLDLSMTRNLHLHSNKNPEVPETAGVMCRQRADIWPVFGITAGQVSQETFELTQQLR